MNRFLCRKPGRAVALLLIGFAPVLPSPGQADDAVAAGSLIELIHAAADAGHHVVSVNLEAAVWWSGNMNGRVVLADETATAQLELDLPCRMPVPGDRLRLSGRCTVVKARDAIKISPVPVVEADGLHSMEDRSGSVFLPAGRHALRVAWFNRTGLLGLTVDYEGPDLPRQPIDPRQLVYPVADAANGELRYAPGLRYRCYEDQWWRLLPNFDHINPIHTGVCDGFDLGVRSRDSHVGLLFEGCITIPREGNYTFYLSSDDGSRLFIGPSTLEVEPVAHACMPEAAPLAVQHGMPEPGREYSRGEIEGTVISLHRPHGTLEFEMKTDIGHVRVRIAEDHPDSFTLRPQNRVRIVGVSRIIRDLDGEWVPGEFYAQRWDDVAVLYVSPSIWNEYPVTQITDLVRQGQRASNRVVHVRGRLLRRGDGSVMLDDGSGTIGLPDRRTESYVPPFAELLGRLGFHGTEPVLHGTFYRDAGSLGPDSGDLPLLTTVEQIYQLRPDEAARAYPVRVRGVVTSPMESDGAVLQDASRGIYIDLGGPINLQIGDFCEIEGFTGPFEFSQYIEAASVRILGAGSLPVPIRPTWDQLINGSMHCNYVELEGVVTSVWDHRVSLLTRGGRINVRINPAGPKMPENSLGATIRLRGCLLADWDGESHRVVVGSIYLDQHWIAVVHPAALDPFATPLKRVGDLLQFDPDAGALQRVRVSGQLVYRGDDLCCLMDGAIGLRFEPAEGIASEVGDLVDVVGYLELGGSASVLREARVRSTGRALLPEPRLLEPADLLRAAYDSVRVRVGAVLLEVRDRPGGAELELQAGLTRFVAEIAEGRLPDAGLRPGSRLELTGIYLGQGGNRVLGRPISSFRLLLNNADEIVVVSRPPWWTLKRLLTVVGILLAVLLAAVVWISLLHHRVEERTLQLGDQIRQRQLAERQREIEQERARLAHDLHDDLGAGLTEVNMLTSLISSPATSPDEKAAYIEDLHGTALRMVTSLDEIVWAVNPRNDTLVSLAGYFSSYAQRLLELAAISCRLEVADDLPAFPLEPRVRQELFLALKEALTNVVQHAQATKVWLRIGIEEGVLFVVVSDNGSGRLPDKHEAGADGLANMRERMQSLGGNCRIEGVPGKGATVRLEVPVREEQR